MVIARQGEEIVCPKGTLCGRIIRDAEDRITDDDFSTAESDATDSDGGLIAARLAKMSAAEREAWAAEVAAQTRSLSEPPTIDHEDR